MFHYRFLQANEISDEFITTIISEIEVLLQNNSVCISNEEVIGVIEMIDIVLDDREYGPNHTIPSELLHKLDALGGRVNLDGESTAVLAQDNVALLMADATPDEPVRGLRVKAGEEDGFRDRTFEFISGNDSSVSLISKDTEALVLLPESVTQSPRRISFVVFGNDVAFAHQQNCLVNSHIFSINVENFTAFEKGEVVDLMLKPFKRKPRRNETRACAYWHFADNGTGHWSQDGCTFIRARHEDSLDICRCDHLTHFAQVLVTRDVFSERQESMLGVISIVGCSFSIFGTFIVALTGVLFKSWRRNDSNKVWLNLCSSVFTLNICFLVTVFVKFEEYNINCILVGIALHYSVLATFCWMLVVSILSYRKLVLVFTRDIPKKFVIASSFSWGFPFFVIGLLLAINPESYSKKFEEKTPNGAFCYPSGLGLWLAVLGPVMTIWLVNWILYALIIRSMFVNKNIRRHSGSRENFRSASVSFLLAFLCGVPWVFGFFAFNIVGAYLFTLTVSFQGFVLFLFFVLGNGKTRRLWVNMLSRKVMGRDPGSPLNSSVRRQTQSTTDTRFYVPRPIVSFRSSEAHDSLLSETRL